MLSNMLAGQTRIPRQPNPRKSMGFPTMSPTAAPATSGGVPAPAAVPAPAPAPAPVENHPADVITAGGPPPTAAPAPAPSVPTPTAPAAPALPGHLADRIARLTQRNPARAGFLQALFNYRSGGREGARPHMRDFRTGGVPAPAPAGPSNASPVTTPAPAPAPIPAPAPAPAPLPASAVNTILPPQIYQLLGMGG